MLFSTWDICKIDPDNDNTCKEGMPCSDPDIEAAREAGIEYNTMCVGEQRTIG